MSVLLKIHLNFGLFSKELVHVYVSESVPLVEGAYMHPKAELSFR
jgi:hypothetical protein